MNLGELKTQLRAHGYETDTDDVQEALINAAYRDVAGERRWWWLETTLDISMASGDRSAALSLISDYRALLRVRLESGGEWSELGWVEPQELLFMRTQYPDSTGLPTAWSRVNQSVEFWPTLDAAATAYVDYVREAPALQDDSDEPLFPAVYHDILVWGPLRSMAYRQRDWAQHGVAVAEHERLLMRMRNEEASVRQQQSSTRVVQSGWYGA